MHWYSHTHNSLGGKCCKSAVRKHFDGFDGNASNRRKRCEFEKRNWNKSTITNPKVKEHLGRGYLNWLSETREITKLNDIAARWKERNLCCCCFFSLVISFPVAFEKSSKNYKRNLFKFRHSMLHRFIYVVVNTPLNYAERIVPMEINVRVESKTQKKNPSRMR